MRVFLSVQHLGSFLVYEPVIRELAARGHHVHIAVSRNEALGWEKTLEAVVNDHPQITFTRLSPSPTTSTLWFDFSRTVRLWADSLRYAEPAYESAPKLRERAEERVPPMLVRFSRRPAFQRAKNRARLLAALWTVDRSLPVVSEIRQRIREYGPDVVLITPLVYLGSWQFEILRAALAEGLRTVFGVGSWDHLSSKALVRDMPLRVLVWNDTQKDEAIRLHGVPADRVIVTGAQCYDQWFGRTPRRSRTEFCAHVGLPDDRPFFLYVCSALFWGSPVEAEFVRRWVQSVRESSIPEIRNAAILIRPHPARMEEWKAIDLSAFEGVALYGSNPMDTDSREDYFESLFFSSAVVGLNTSAFLEAAIVGKPVHTILVPEFADNQQGTLHFHYLLRVGGGVLQTSTTFDENHAHLAESLRTRDDARRVHPFVTEFIRPHGLTRAATPILCDALETVAQLPTPAPASTPMRLVALRWIVYPIFLALRQAFGTEIVRDDWRRTDREHQQRLQVLEQERLARQQASADTKRDREVRRAAKAAARDAAMKASEAARAQAEREKAKEKDAKVRAKAAREKQRRRAALRSRLANRARGWIGLGRDDDAGRRA
jgi:hypothetical protein